MKTHFGSPSPGMHSMMASELGCAKWSKCQSSWRARRARAELTLQK